MKKLIRNLFLVMAFAVIAAFAANADEAYAEDAKGEVEVVKINGVASGTAIWYNAEKDAIEVVATDENPDASVEYKIFVLKEAKGTIKKGAKPKATLKLGESKTMKELGLSSTTKDAYLYCTEKELSADKDTNASANIKVAKQTAKSLKVTINYAAAGIGDDEETVLIPAATDYAKKTIEINVEWSADDGKTWNEAKLFDGAKLNELLAANKKVKLLVREKGTSGVGDAKRTGKPAKVTVAMSAKAPKIKIDVKKSTISIKNGYDFAPAVASGDAFTATIAGCQTILPYNKESKKTEAIIATSDFVPKDKKAKGALDAGSVSFTSTKLKALSVEEALEKVGSSLNTDTSIAVRKSATNKKPASQFSYLKITTQAAAPFVETETSLEGDNLICTADAKGTFIVPEIHPAGKYKIEEGAVVADGDKAVTDTASVLKYEYIIVKSDDIKNLDYAATSWKSLKAGGKIKSTASTKYTVTASGKTEKKSAALTDTGAVLLIRRAGVKASSGSDAVLASNYVTTSIKKGTSGAYEWSITSGLGERPTGNAYVLNIWELDKKGNYVCTSSEVVYNKGGNEVTVDIPSDMAIDLGKSTSTAGSGTITAKGFTPAPTGKTVVNIYFKAAPTAAPAATE